jgi:hypothetical protein
MLLKLEGLDKKATRTELKLENETNRAIQATQDGHKDLTRKIDAALDIHDRVVVLENKVSAIEYSLNRAT